MAGAADVYLKQAGTGAAWIGPKSSFDPVRFAREGAALRRLAAEKKKEQDKATIGGLFPGKYAPILERDALNGRKKIGSHIMNLGIERLKQRQAEGGGLTNIDEAELKKYADDWAQLESIWATQKKDFDEYEKLIYEGKVKGYDQEQMDKRRALYYDPTQFFDDEEFGEFAKESYSKIEEEVKSNPYYKDYPDLVKDIAITEWRSRYKNDILQPIIEPTSLYKNFRENVNPLMSEFKDAKSITLANGQVVTTENLLQLPDDIDATVKLADGREIQVTLPGIRTLAGTNYDTDKAVQYSASIYFNKAGDNIKQEYIDKFGDQAVREWYKDEMANANVSVKGNVKVKQAPGGYSKVGGQTVPENLTIAIDKKEINLNRGGQTYNEETGEYSLVKDYGKVDVQGYTVGKGKNTEKEPVFQFNSPVIYDQNNVPWDLNKSQYAENFNIKVTGVYRMPSVTKDINLSKYPDLQKWIIGRYKKASATIKPGDKPSIIKAGTPITDEEVKKIVEYSELPGNEELKNVLGADIFVMGNVQGEKLSKTKEGYENFSVQGALIPYRNIKGQWEKQTDFYDWEAAIKADFGDAPNYYELYRTRPKLPAKKIPTGQKVSGAKKAGEF